MHYSNGTRIEQTPNELLDVGSTRPVLAKQERLPGHRR
jgi:hypothetical protein